MPSNCIVKTNSKQPRTTIDEGHEKIYFYGIILAFAILSITLLATMGIWGVFVGYKDIKQEENTPTSRKINTTIVILGIITVITRASLVPGKVISGEIVLAKTKEIMPILRDDVGTTEEYINISYCYFHVKFYQSKPH